MLSARTLRFSRSVSESGRCRRRLGIISMIMCEELRTRVLRLEPRAANANGLSALRWRDQPGERRHTDREKRRPLLRSLDSSKVLEITAKALKEGEVVAVPTDTLYGLACLAQNSEAIKKVYDMKGRNGKKPLAICVGEIEDIYRYCKVTVPESLLRDLLPGPVTLVLERSETLNEDLNPFTPLVGVRIPDSGFIRQLSQMCGEPLALTSANVSSHRSTVAVHEFRDLWPRLGLVVDGGQIGDRSPQSRLGSTVIDLSVPGKYRIIRPGCALSSTTDVLKLQYNLLQDAAGH
ncbi:threonylcarbamoyl-AMP synthase isoform X1 [Scleropages formosus]|uniref:threonylcarbamoyl-AMP synthase isoform X1 n=1 Tax=Scleropages formosus TaxID=113540 RepID=UPI0010FA6C1C|nr:yrdC domain-containing protein, mitochondrial isoform X1 [Scleropages formosus]